MEVAVVDRLRVAGRGTTRAEDAQGTPTQSHITPSILVYEKKIEHLASVEGAVIN